jgi:hypothetical protein
VGRDSTSATIRFAQANMFSSQAHAPDPAVSGRPITYSLAVGNRGPDGAVDASLQFSAFGIRRSITRVTTTRDTCTADTSGCCVTCRFGLFAPGDSARVQITLLPLDEGFLSVSVQASSLTPDPDFSDNASFSGVQVLFSAEQRLTALIALVQSYPIHKGSQKTLVDRLQDARTAVTAGDTTAACAALVDFRQRVAKLSGRGLTLTQAITLDQEAGLIQQRLHCTKPALGPAAARELPTAFAFRLASTVGVSAQAALALPTPAPVRLDVFDLNGRLVRTAFESLLAPGEHTLAWDGHGQSSGRAPSGVYFLRVTAGRETAVSRFVLLR